MEKRLKKCRELLSASFIRVILNIAPKKRDFRKNSDVRNSIDKGCFKD